MNRNISLWRIIKGPNREQLVRLIKDEVNVKEVIFDEKEIFKNMNNTVKENKEISKGEARFIQYSKIIMMFLFLAFLFLKFVDKTLILSCY